MDTPVLPKDRLDAGGSLATEAFPAARPSRRVVRRAVEWLLVLATGTAAAIPVLVSTVRALRAHWVPGADQAIIATRAYDVFTDHTPLVGQHTLASGVGGTVTRNLGPMLFWLVALPSRFGGPDAMVITMGAFNTLVIVACVALARRRGGAVLMLATAVGVALMCQSLAAEAFHDVLNPSAALFPLLLLIFLSWSVACGDHRLLPAAIVAASFVAQAHFTYVLPAAGLLLVAIGGLIVVTVVRLRSQRAAAGRARPSRWSLARWAIAAVVLGALCWTPPLIDQLTSRPGNITAVLRTQSANKVTLGATAGSHAVVRAVGVTPWWLYVPHSKWERKYDVRPQPSALRRDTTVAFLAALGVAGLVGLLRRRADVLAAALIGFVLCLALGGVAASTPASPKLSETLGYTMWWGSQVGLWVWLIVAWSGWLAARWVARLIGARLVGRVPARRWAAPAWAAGVAVVAVSLLGLGGVAATGSAVAGTEKPDEHVALYRPIAYLADRLDRAVSRGKVVQLQGWLSISSGPIKPALRYFLVRHGVRALARGSNLRLGDWYELHNRPYDASLYVVESRRAPVPHVAPVARVSYADGWGPHVVSLWIGPGDRSAPRRIHGVHRPPARK